MELIKRGDLARDKVTGFEGVVTAKYIFLNGCVQFGLKSQTFKDEKPKEMVYVDEQQAELVKRGVVSAAIIAYDPEIEIVDDVKRGPGGPDREMPPAPEYP